MSNSGAWEFLSARVKIFTDTCSHTVLSLKPGKAIRCVISDVSGIIVGLMNEDEPFVSALGILLNFCVLSLVNQRLSR